ncbi:unnamed protein product, partial [Effrenium voratum]
MYQRRTLRRLQDLCSGRGFSDRARLLEDIRDRAKHRTEVANAVQRLLQHGPLKNAEEAAICAAALSRRKLWAQGLELVKDFEGAGSTTGLNAAINTCRAGSNWELGLCLAMESAAEWDGITYSMVLSACSRGSRWELAVQLLQRADRLRLGVGSHVASAAISACGKGKKWEEALAILDRASSTDAPETLLAAAIDACRRADRWEAAVAVFQRLRDSGASSAEGAGAAVSVLAHSTHWAEALQLFESEFLRPSERSPGVRGFVAALQACAAGSNWQIALDLLEQMPRRQLPPDKGCFRIALQAYRQAQDCAVE